MSNVNYIEPTAINLLLVLSPYIFGFFAFYRTAEIGKSILTFVVSVPVVYYLIYTLNNIPF